MTIDLTLKIGDVISTVKAIDDIEELESAIARESVRATPRQKVINACRETIKQLGRVFTPPPPAKQWDNRTLRLSAFLDTDTVSVYNLAGNFRNDIKSNAYKSNILASALHDGNIAPSDWTPTGKRLNTGQAILQSEDGRQRTEALVGFIHGKFAYVYQQRFAAPWLEQYDGLYFVFLPSDAKQRVRDIEMRMRGCQTTFTLEEHCKYFDSRQQTSVTTPGERLTATASLNWALPMYKCVYKCMLECNLSKASQKRAQGMKGFVRLARTVLASAAELQELGQSTHKWVDGSSASELDQLIDWLTNHELAMSNDECEALLKSTFKNVNKLQHCFLAPDGKSLAPDNKKLHFLVSNILVHPKCEEIVLAMSKTHFTIPSEFVKEGRKWEFVRSEELLGLIDAHCEKIIQPIPSPRPQSLIEVIAAAQAQAHAEAATAHLITQSQSTENQEHWHDAIDREQLINCVQAEIINGTGGMHVIAQLDELSATPVN